jgi:hypothetical protein
MEDINSQIVWSQYYQNTKGRAPSRYLVTAVSMLSQSQLPPNQCAIDLGCGDGVDMRFLLQAGFDVIGVDNYSGAHMELIKTLEGFDKPLWEFVNQSMETFDFPRCGLINASSSLFFNSREAFLSVWESMRTSLDVGGFLVVDVLGDKDDWVSERGYGGFTKMELSNLLNGYEVLLLDEDEPESRFCADKVTQKTWHTFSVIAKKVL